MAGEWSLLNALLGANVPGSAIVSVAYNPTSSPYTATTISIDETNNSFNDSAAGMPIFPVGTFARVSGAASGEANADHVVVSSTASELVVATDLTVAEGAGASITVEEIPFNYKMTLDELNNFVAAGGSTPDPLVGHTFKDSRHTAVIANVATTTTRSASDGNVHEITLTADTTIEVELGAGEASYLHLIIIPGAFTATLGASFHKWIGSAPGTIGARHHIMVASVDAGTTNEAKDNGVSA